MRTDKNIALRARRNGKSFSEIQKLLGGVSKGTLSLWLRDVVLSPRAQHRLLTRTQKRSLAALVQRNKDQTFKARERRDGILLEYSQKIRRLSSRDLVILLASLYWAEGHKRSQKRGGRETTSHGVSLTNADPVLLRLFIHGLRDLFDVPSSKVKVGLRLFEHINEEKAVRYWSRALGVSRQNFGKTYWGISVSSQRKRPFNRLPFGVVQIRINDTNLFHKIMGLIEGLKNVSLV